MVYAALLIDSQAENTDSGYCCLIPMTHTPETGTLNRLCFLLAPVFRTIRSGMKISGAHSHNSYHRPIISHHFGHMHATFWLGIEQCSNWHFNLVPNESGSRYA